MKSKMLLALFNAVHIIFNYFISLGDKTSIEVLQSQLLRFRNCTV